MLRLRETLFEAEREGRAANRRLDGVELRKPERERTNRGGGERWRREREMGTGREGERWGQREVSECEREGGGDLKRER